MPSLNIDIDVTPRQRSIFEALRKKAKTMSEIVAFVGAYENRKEDPSHRSIGNTMKDLRLRLIERGSAWRLITEGKGRGPGYRYVYRLVHHKQGEN